MSLKIEGANSEVSSKIKSAEAKLLAKGKSKMPHAKEFKVKMRPNLVKASKGSFYGGHLYGTEDGAKWLKCAEVRIREGKEGAAPSPKPSKPVAAERPKIEKLKKELEKELATFINSKLLSAETAHSYRVSKVTLDAVHENGARGEIKIKCSMKKPIETSFSKKGRKYAESKAWELVKDATRANIMREINNQTIKGMELETSTFIFATNIPKGDSFVFSFIFRLRR